jgi:hypothetical protein
MVAGRRTSPAKGSPSEYRATRHKREAQRTRANALLILAADARTLYRGADHTVAKLASALGFERHDLTIVRAVLGRRTITLIITPRRLWHRPECHSQLILLKRHSRNVGIRTILMAEAQLRKQPRLDNAAQVVAAGQVRLTLSQRFRLEIYLMTNPDPVPLGECAALLAEHDDPVSAVLGLVYAGHLSVDLNRNITPETLVHLAARSAGSST